MAQDLNGGSQHPIDPNAPRSEGEDGLDQNDEDLDRVWEKASLTRAIVQLSC
jgi:hypothetical protein